MLCAPANNKKKQSINRLDRGHIELKKGVPISNTAQPSDALLMLDEDISSFTLKYAKDPINGKEHKATRK